MFIEYDGRHHFIAQRFATRVTQEEAESKLILQQEKDKMKDDYCNDNGYLLLRISYLQNDDIDIIVRNFIGENLIVPTA
jgi:very-short-patch-repair endonuclease